MGVKTVFRLLLYFYPAAFRHEYGDQMTLLFAEQVGEARRNGDRLRAARLWSDAALDTLFVAPKEHGNVIRQDLRYALRLMSASKGFSAVAILSLMLGIGVNTAIFSLWNGVLHSPIPGVFQPEQLAILSNPNAEGGWNGSATGDRDWLTYAEFEQLRDHARSFSGLMASQSFLDKWPVRFIGGEWEEAHGRLVSGEYFQVLGVGTTLGRVFTAADDRAASPYAVISYDYWQHRFGGSEDVLGRTFTLRSAELTIIGVAPEGFVGETVGQQPDMWVPMHMQPTVRPGSDLLHDTPPSKAMWLHVFGRLKPGVTLERAGAEANAIFKAELESFYGGVTSPERRREYLDQRLKIRSGARGASETRSNFSTSLTALLAAVGLLLLIACANLANLLLARGSARRSEIALRLSLGANRGRLIRQLITESLVLSAAGGLTGLAAAYWFHGALVRMIVQSDEDFRLSFGLDPTVLIFTLVITVATAILAGLLPAWQSTKAGAGTMPGERSRGSFEQTRWGRRLVSLQLALSLPLLMGAGLLVRTLHNLQHEELGYPAEHLLHIHVNARQAGYDPARSGALFHQLLSEIRTIPSVKYATFSMNGLFTGTHSNDTVEVEGFTPKAEADRHSAFDLVGPEYFSTLGVPLILGRDILESDGAGAPKVCVINEAFARRFFAGRNPIGMRVMPVDDERRTTYAVVGVAKNARTEGLRGVIAPKLYMPATQPPGDSLGRVNFLIRSAGATAPMLAAVRQAFRRVDASLPILSAHSIEQQMAPLTAQDRTIAQLALVFGCAALMLAAIGLYGVLSYAVARRTGEIAIRIALGAQPGIVIAMILRETAGLVLGGLAVGACLAYPALQFIGSRLYGVAPLDPATLALATAMLLLVALSAAYLPARRAAGLDPMTALRQE